MPKNETAVPVGIPAEEARVIIVCAGINNDPITGVVELVGCEDGVYSITVALEAFDDVIVLHNTPSYGFDGCQNEFWRVDARSVLSYFKKTVRLKILD